MRVPAHEHSNFFGCFQLHSKDLEALARAWEETLAENPTVVNVNCVISENVEIPLGGDLLK